MSTDDVSALLEIYAIQQLKYRYMRAVDSHDWNLMADCFAEDASVWYNSGFFKCEGRENILQFFRGTLDTFLFSSHIAVHPEIALTGPNAATGMWRIQDIVFNVQPDRTIRQPGKIRGGQRMEGAGHYYDEYIKLGAKWVIKTSGYVRIYEYANRPDYKHVDDADFDGDHYLRTPAARGMRK